MKNILSAAFFCALLAGGTGAYGQQVQVLKADGPAPAAKDGAKAGAGPEIIVQEEKPAKAAAPAKKGSQVMEKAPAKPSGKKTSPAKSAAVKPVQVAEFAPKFEMQPPARTAMGMELPPAMKLAPAAAPKAAAAAPKSAAMGTTLPAPMKPAAAPARAAAPAMALPPPMKPAVVKTAVPAAPAAPSPSRAGGFSVEKKHKVTGGETLWDLSGKYYSDPYKWGKIYNANLDTVRNPDLIYPAEELVIPDITEEVRPARKAPAAISGSDTFSEGDFSVTEIDQVSAPAAGDADTRASASMVVPARKAPGASERGGMNSVDRDGLSAEMPEDQKEWASFLIVPDTWLEDGVVASKGKGGAEDSMEGELAVSGETVTVRLTGPARVKKDDFLTVYLRGAAAFDKKGKRLGRELQPVGKIIVLSVAGRAVKGQLLEASATVTKGMVVKLGARP